MGLTLRQIEVIRAVMIAGTIAGAARLMNVAQPGVSRTMKHIQSALGIKLFVRKAGRYVPTAEARDVFAQLQEVHRKVDDLQFSIGQLERGRGVELALGSVPSIANAMVPQAIATLMRRHPDIRINFDILRIEEAIDYLLLGKGELVAMSYHLSHPSITFEPLSRGHLVCIAAREHPIAERTSISAREIAGHPLIGLDPRDPYGAIIAGIFESEGLEYYTPIRARFGTTVCAGQAEPRHRCRGCIHRRRYDRPGACRHSNRRGDRLPDLCRLPRRCRAFKLCREVREDTTPGHERIG